MSAGLDTIDNVAAVRAHVWRTEHNAGIWAELTELAAEKAELVVDLEMAYKMLGAIEWQQETSAKLRRLRQRERALWAELERMRAAQ